MAFTRKERNTALSCLVKQDYAALGRLVEETTNLNQGQKIDLLSSLLVLASPGARISYNEEARQAIDDCLEVINDDRVVRPVSQLGAQS